jgi:hypothetical protein
MIIYFHFNFNLMNLISFIESIVHFHLYLIFRHYIHSQFFLNFTLTHQSLKYWCMNWKCFPLCSLNNQITSRLQKILNFGFLIRDYQNLY